MSVDPSVVRAGDPSATPPAAQDKPPPALIAPPSIALPTGGGALRGLGETFTANPARGTGTLTVPLPVSPARSSFQPQLQLAYDSAAGNGPFGLGWDVALPSVGRRTDNGLPRYDDTAESDVFVLSGSEDLVPALRLDAEGEVVRDGNGRAQADETEIDGYRVRRYRPRTEGPFARIERWTHPDDPADVHWRTLSRDNVTTVYGADAESRIADPDDPARIARWLVCASHDDRGSEIRYEYRAEDGAGVDPGRSSERHRLARPAVANRYLKAVRYGNRVSRLHPDPPDDLRDTWLFEIVFDYGEGHYALLPLDAARPADEQHRRVRATAAVAAPWPVRPDAFSTYRFGFEVRTSRRCARILMFHRIPELSDEPCLVRSVELDFADLADPPSITAELAHQGSTAFASLLTGITQHGYVPDPDTPGQYLRASRPALGFTYSRPRISDEVGIVDPDSIANLPTGLGAPVQWVDLDAEGLCGALVEQGDAWWYKRNEGGGVLAPLELVAQRPSGGLADGRMLLDLGGDGPLDLVDLGGPAPGFHERTDDGGWSEHRGFPSLPRLDWGGPGLRFTDLDGDGRADVLLADPERVTWYPSLGEDGFGPAELVPWPADAEREPPTVLDGLTPSYATYMADMTGDGLADLVRIGNGEVCYRPSLGRGRFGATVVMDDPPRFDHEGGFDARRLRLVDIDGSGVTDLVHLGHDGARAYLNRSGNGWSGPVELPAFPSTDDVTSVAALDLLGTGTACLVWSSPLPVDATAPLRYLDLAPGGKPHLLVGMTNNLGAETVVGYAPSTRFFLDDRRAGTPWVTRLPFPVQVVERVESVDRISGSRFVTRYSYHHGFYDGAEREFRGFGRVDQWDAEERGPASTPTDLPPVRTRTWFHTGAYLGRDRISTQLAGEYFADPAAPLLDDTVLELPADADPDDEREACRALRGTMLRQEVYADDGSAEQDFPYLVTEQNTGIRPVQPRAGHRHAVFVTHPRESVAHHYERALADPRVVHEVTLAVNRYAQVTRSVRIAYGRRAADAALPEPARTAQTTPLAICTDYELTDAVDEPHDHRLPAPRQTSTFELTGLPAAADRLTFEQVEKAVRNAAATDPENAPTPGNTEIRLVARERTRYRRDDLTGPNDVEKQGRRALVHETYRLAFSPGLLARTYRRDGAALLPDPSAVLAVDAAVGGSPAGDRGGHVDLDGDGWWWVPSGRTFLTPDAAAPDAAATAAQELDHARRHFFLPHRFRTPFHQADVPVETTVGYDVHDLAVTTTVDPADNQTVAELDYRVLAPRHLTDPNGSHTEAAFDALGLVVATAVRSRDDDVPVRGDTLDGVTPDLTRAEIEAAFTDPTADPHTMLGSATTRLVYDLFAHQRSAGDPRPSPIGVYTIARETQVSEAPGATSALQHRFSYSDGFGREIQQKLQAEPDDTGAPRWVGSGRVELNNKGKPVREWEPFFDDTHRARLGAAVGVARTLCYDPLTRLVAVLHPNRTYEKVVFDAWQESSHDVNDTVVADPRTDADVGALLAPLLPGGAGWTTWYAQRSGGGRGADEADAAAKASAQADTPTGRYLDPLGRVVLSRAHDGLDAAGKPVFLDMQWVLGIGGEQRAVVDAAGRTAVRYDHDLLDTRTRTASTDAGDRWLLPDATGTPVREWDGRGHATRVEYDRLRRPRRRFVRGLDAARSDPDTHAGELLVEETEYGEGRPNPERGYLRAQVFRRHDSAGTVVYGYDFRGNVVRTAREIVSTYDRAIDWAQPQAVEGPFVTTTRFDALARPIQVVTPHLDQANAPRTVVQPVYNAANLLERLDVWLLRPADPAGLIDAAADAPSRAGIAALAYNARGQRTEVLHRNGVHTRSVYDDDTFRLVHLYTRRGAAFTDDCGADPPPPRTAAPADPPAGVPCGVQNLHYTWDPVGNLTRIRDHAQQRVFFRNQLVDPTNDYTYDPVYRLVRATGREQLAAGARVPHSHDDALRVDIAHPGDGDALGNYCETYEYDAVGNLAAMRHLDACPGVESWVRTFSYAEPGPGNRLTSSTVAGTTETYSTGGDGYDANGNMVRMPQLQEVAWDHRDRLRMTRRQAVGNAAAAERTYYVYDASGERVRKVTVNAAGALTEERLYLGGGVELYRRHTGPAALLVRETVHLMDDEQRVALVETRNDVDDGSPVQVIRYQYGNHLGSASLELDEQARVISYEEYTPYGSTSYQGVTRNIQVPLKRYRFTGKERDEESGLSYHGARYYAPWLGRWTACDPLGLKDSPNLYLYALANPVIAKDPTGGPIWLIPVAIYLGYRALESAAETGIEAGIAKATGDQDFSAGGAFLKNMAVNTVTGLIPGAVEAKIGTKAAIYGTKLLVATTADATLDTVQGKGEFGESFVKSGLGNVLGDAGGALGKKALGKIMSKGTDDIGGEAVQQTTKKVETTATDPTKQLPAPAANPMKGATDAEIDAAVTATGRTQVMVEAPAGPSLKPLKEKPYGDGGRFWGLSVDSKTSVPGATGDVKTILKIHDADPTAPVGVNSRLGMTLGIEQGKGNRRLVPDSSSDWGGRWIDKATATLDDWNASHIPLFK
jgi:RHS repeat-associated protein